MCFHHGNDLVVVADLQESKTGGNRVFLEDLSERYSIKVFTAVPFSDLKDLGRQYDFLVRIRDLENRSHIIRDHNCIYAMELVPHYYVETLRSDAFSRSMCSPDAEKLLEHDKENGTELFGTYLFFLLNDRNLVKTAKELNIHRNTLVYRIERIREIISADDDDHVQKLHMLASMLIIQSEQQP